MGQTMARLRSVCRIKPYAASVMATALTVRLGRVYLAPLVWQIGLGAIDREATIDKGTADSAISL